MTRSALALLSALVALPTLAHAQESPPATSELYDALAHAPFCEADATFEPRLAMRLGFIELGRHDLIEPTLQCLFDLRAAHPTGENGEVIGPALAALLAEDPGAHVLPYCLSGGTDNKALARLGITGYGFAPLRLPPDLDFVSMFHGIDERVPLDSLAFGARVLRRFLDLA